MRPAVWAMAAAALAACGDPEFMTLQKRPAAIGVEGTFCAGPPAQAFRTTNVLFLVDSSGSMRFNDPEDLLVDAIEHLTQKYADQEQLAYSVIRFGSDRFVRENVDYDDQAPLFTADPGRLSEIFARMRDPANPDKYLDGSNYLLGLRTANQYILLDRAARPEQAATARYVVVFVTDGMPQSATTNPQDTVKQILAEVSGLHTNYGVQFDVVSVGLSQILAPEFVDLLPNMAKTGGGVYTALSSPGGADAAFERALANSSLLVEYELAAFLAYNRNVRFGRQGDGLGLHVDSDGDGLSDEEEEARGLDPAHPDTDGDLLSDFFEWSHPAEFDPAAFNLGDRGEDGDLDPDRDGFTNFEERRLLTDPKNPDSDRDGLPDDIELFSELDPRHEDVQTDLDGDQVPGGIEVREHTHPMELEAPAQRELAYRTQPLTEVAVATLPSEHCYAFRVENITALRTRAAVDRGGRATPAGLNVVEVIAVFKPVLKTLTATETLRYGVPHRQRRAWPWLLVRADGSRDPGGLTLHVLSQDFVR